MERFLKIGSEERERLKFIDEISEDIGKTLPPPDTLLKMVVIIPAKDEAHQIEYTLESLSKQSAPDNSPICNKSFEVLVLCHNCTDDTFGKVANFLDKNPRINGHVLNLNSDTANTVGAARRVLMNIAFHRLSKKNGLIISTDADTVPHPHWLYNLNRYVDSDIDFICGKILPNYENLEPQALRLLLAKDEYLHLKSELGSIIFPNPNDPWPKHEYHWGPNIAIKKYVYGALGGIRPLHFLEDVDLYNRAVGNGYKVRHCNDTLVTTSTRIESRCTEGFGAELKDWTTIPGVSYKVEGLQKLLLRFEIYGLIRKLFLSYSERTISELSQMSMMKRLELKALYKNSVRPESVLIAMEEHLNKCEAWNYQNPNTCVFIACEELKTYISFIKDKKKAILSSPLIKVQS